MHACVCVCVCALACARAWAHQHAPDPAKFDPSTFFWGREGLKVHRGCPIAPVYSVHGVYPIVLQREKTCSRSPGCAKIQNNKPSVLIYSSDVLALLTLWYIINFIHHEFLKPVKVRSILKSIDEGLKPAIPPPTGGGSKSIAVPTLLHHWSYTAATPLKPLSRPLCDTLHHDHKAPLQCTLPQPLRHSEHAQCDFHFKWQRV